MLNPKSIGNKITEARKKMNISQAQLAEQLFITYQAVGKWERGESMPDIITINRLAEILRVDLNYFLAGLQTVASELKTIGPEAELPVELPLQKQQHKQSWDMSGGNWVDADFSGLKNLHEKFSGANLQRCKFIGSDLSGLLLKGNNLQRCDFSGSDISNSKIQRSHIDHNLFKNTRLKETEFLKTHLQSCDFSDSDFSGADIRDSYFNGNLFNHCSLKGAGFYGSHVNGCDLSGADFTGTVLKSGGFGNNKIVDTLWSHSSSIGMQIEDVTFEGQLENCYFENCAFNWVKFENVTFRSTFFKNNVFKRNRVKFVNCHSDQLSYEFLKTGIADVSGISLLSD